MINRGRSARSAAFAAFAVLTFAGSRVMLAGRPEGLLAWVYVVVIVVLAAGFVAAAQGESFRAGLVNGYVVLVAGLAAVVAVAAAEAVTWYHRAGVLIIDGDLPSGGIAGPGAAVADAVTGMTFFVLLFATPWPALGAAAGALCVRLGRVRTAAGDRY